MCITLHKMSEKTDKIIELLKDLSLVEASELVNQVEEVFNVDCSFSGGPIMASSPTGSGDTPAITEEKTEFDVSLEGVPNSSDRIKVIKVIRTLTSLGLKEAKGLVEAAPKVIKEGISKDEAADVQKQLEEAGAKVSVS